MAPMMSNWSRKTRKVSTWISRVLLSAERAQLVSNSEGGGVSNSEIAQQTRSYKEFSGVDEGGGGVGGKG